MRSNLAAAAVYIATIMLAFGIVITVIELLGSRYGTGHESARMLAIGLLIIGALLAGSAKFLRSRDADPRV